MSGFLHIKEIIIPTDKLNEVYTFLREAGQEGVEGVALFAGHESSDRFVVTTGIIPVQASYQLESGLLYAVEGTELHKINVWLHTHKLNLIAQIHTHPGKAYHSGTDNRYPIVDTHGSVSIVVPDFARRSPRVKDWAIYRCLPEKGWVELSSSQIRKLIRLV
jgi:hypothetical protein